MTINWCHGHIARKVPMAPLRAQMFCFHRGVALSVSASSRFFAEPFFLSDCVHFLFGPDAGVFLWAMELARSALPRRERVVS